MLQIMPVEELTEFLDGLQCPCCGRQLQNHTPLEQRTCHDHALTTVTLLHQAEQRNLLASNKQERCD